MDEVFSAHPLDGLLELNKVTTQNTQHTIKINLVNQFIKKPQNLNVCM